MFQRFEHQPDASHCAMLGYPVEPTVDRDFPKVMITISSYSAGYFFKEQLDPKLRQTRAGTDIPSWARNASNYEGEDSRTDEIVSFENPTYHLMRLLWPINESTGEISDEKGYYNLYPGKIMPVPNWGLGSGDPVKVTAVLAAGATTLYVADLSQFPTPSATTYVKIFSYSDKSDDGGDDDGSYDEGEETGDSEICHYTARSGSTGVGYLTIVRSDTVVWNPSNSMAQYVKGSNYNPNHKSVEKKQYFWDGETTIASVLEQYQDDCYMISFTRIEYCSSAGEWREYFYWIPMYTLEEDKGNYLNLPTDITVINPGFETLEGTPGLSSTISYSDYFNRVVVEACRTKDSAWFYASAETAAVTAGKESKQTLHYATNSLLPDPVGSTWNSRFGTISTSSNFGPVTDGGISYGTAAEDAECQALTQALANEIVSYIGYCIPQYEATFKDTYFEHYQRIQFTGFDGVPETVMRITDLEYTYNPPGDGGMSCKITCTPATTLQKSGKFQSLVDEIQAYYTKLKESASDSASTNKRGVVISTNSDNTIATVQFRSSGALIRSQNYGLRKAVSS